MLGKLSKSALITLAAAILVAAVGLGITPAHAAPNTAAEPVEVAQGYTSKLHTALSTARIEIAKIPFLGSEINRLLKLASKIKAKGLTTDPYGQYLEVTTGNFAFTFFNFDNFGGQSRFIAGISYKGTLKSPSDGVWSYLPGTNLINPVIFFRLGGISNPIISGSDLKKLPGLLGERTPNAVKVTATLRLPMGAVIVAGVDPTGVFKDALDVFNFPTKNVFVMAGAGLDSYIAGGGDPAFKSREAARSFARPSNSNKEHLMTPKKGIPSPTGYIKISAKGEWYNPAHLFTKKTRAVDPVFMFTYTGDIGAWGKMENLHGIDFVYGIDIPAGLSGLQDIPKLTLGLSFDTLTMGDLVKLQLGLLTQLADPPFLKMLGKLGKETGTSEGKELSGFFGKNSDNIQDVRDALNKAIDTLPLDSFKLTNPKFVDYKPVSEDYPKVETFAFFFSASQGILPDGSFGPKFITNADMEIMGQKLAETETNISLGNGFYSYHKNKIDLTLGKVLGETLKLEGERVTVIEANLDKGVFSKQTMDWNLLGVSKGDTTLEFSLKPPNIANLRVILNPADGCVPPVPLNVDANINLPHSFADLKKEIVKLGNDVEFSPGGVVKCGETIYELAKKGFNAAKPYVNIGAKFAGKYGKEGTKYVSTYATKGAKEVGTFTANAGATVGNGTVKAGKATYETAKNMANTVSDFVKGAGCDISAFFGKSCPKKPPEVIRPRVSSPFQCPTGSYYNLEFGRCWSNWASMYAFTGAKTTKELCLQANKSGGLSAITLSACTGETSQQFHGHYSSTRESSMMPIKHKPTQSAKVMSFKHHLADTADECVALHGYKLAKGQQIVAGNCKSPMTPKFKLDTHGRLVTHMNNKDLCLRPQSDAVKPNIYGHMADWVRTAGTVQDVAVGTDGTMIGIAIAGGAWEFRPGPNWVNLGGSNLERLDVGSKGEIWAVDKNGAIQRRIGGKWNTVKGRATDIGIGGPEGKTVVVIGRKAKPGPQGFMIYKWDPEKKYWESMKGHAIRVDVDGEGNIWVVQSNGTVWHQSVTGKGGWVKLPAVPDGATDISASMVGTVMVSTSENEIYAWENKSWVRFPGVATNISLDPLGSPWVSADIGNKGTVYAHTSARAVKGWSGFKQLTPLTAPAVNLDGASLTLGNCEEYPVMHTWSQIRPKASVDFAQQAGITGSFSLRTIDGAFMDTGQVPNKHDHLLTGKKNQPAGHEFSAVFKDATNFALYHHETAKCIGNQNSINPQVYPCTFEKDQLWTLKKIKRSIPQISGSSKLDIRFQFKNTKTNSCLASSGQTEPGHWFHFIGKKDCDAMPLNSQWLPRFLPLNSLGTNFWNKVLPWHARGGAYGAPTFTREGDIVTLTGTITGGTDYFPAWTVPKNMAPPKRMNFGSGFRGDFLGLDVKANGQIVVASNAMLLDVEFNPAIRKKEQLLTLSGITYGIKNGKPLTLAPGWKPYGGGYSPPMATKSGNMVVVNGLIMPPGGATTGRTGPIQWSIPPQYGPKETHVATLPVGMRPPSRLIFNVTNHDKPARVDVLANGEVHWVTGGNGHGWVSLNGIVFSTTPSHNLPLSKGWTNFDGGYEQAKITRQGKMVTVSGLIKHNGSPWGEFATLPPGYRPPKQMYFYVNDNAISARVEVLPNGKILRTQDGRNTQVGGGISLSGITFATNDAMPKKLPPAVKTAPVWIIGMDKAPYAWDPNGYTWVKHKGCLKQISVDERGIPHGIQCNDEVVKWNGKDWVRIGGLKALDLGVGSLLYAIDMEGNPRQWTGKWVPHPTCAKRIDVNNVGTPVIIGCDNSTKYLLNNIWHDMAGGKGHDIASGNETWIIGMDKRPHLWTGKAWVGHKGCLLRLDVGPDGKPWGIGCDNGVYSWNGSGWIKMPGKGYDIGMQWKK